MKIKFQLPGSKISLIGHVITNYIEQGKTVAYKVLTNCGKVTIVHKLLIIK